MCARYTSTKDVEKIRKHFKVDVVEGEFIFPRYNIAPTQDAPVIISRGDKRILAPFHFGMIPHWAKDKSIASKLIQARADTILERPSYRKPILESRCLVIADGFYEWQEVDGANSKPH